MSDAPNAKDLSASLGLDHRMTVLLIDDQEMVGEAVRRMLEPEEDIDFHFCADATAALRLAIEIEPTVILQDLVMPEVNGLTLVRFFRANSRTRDIPVIVLSSKEEPKTKAEAFATGANDYLVKLPDRIELVARIRYHSRGYIHLRQRNEAFLALQESERRLNEDVADASRYVRSLLPAPLRDGIRVQWRFEPSASLGGDAFGYHWIDNDHFTFYLLDVCGHGVKSALLSVSVLNVLRSQNLPETDFRDPGQVLFRLNNLFQMEQHQNLYFTAWVGVYQPSTRTLHYSGGGHPPVLLYRGPSHEQRELVQLASTGPIVGGFEDVPFEVQSVTLNESNVLYLFSDGVFEIHRPDGTMWSMDEMIEFLTSHQTDTTSRLDGLQKRVHDLHGSTSLEDDFSILEILI